MNDQARTPNALRNWLSRRMHVLLIVLGLALLVATLAVWTVDRFGCRAETSCDTLGSLNRAADAEQFEAVIWQTTSEPGVQAATPAAHAPASATVAITPLRWMMFMDSMAIVPAYLGLLLIFLVFLSRDAAVWVDESRGSPWWFVSDWKLQLACGLAVAAAVFDIAENGMTVRAAEDALEQLLADPTVADVHLATRLKWTFIALASALLGVRALAASRRERDMRREAEHWLVAGALACGTTFLLLLVGEYGQFDMVRSIGAVTFGLELFLLGTALWKATSSDDAISHSQEQGTLAT
ncbi:MAG: hypothetical protein ABI645_05355 [Pseudomonadota bacterium]